MKKFFEYLYFEEKTNFITNLMDEGTTVISSGTQLKEQLPTFTQNIFSAQNFYEYIIRKSLKITNLKTLSQNTAIYIIKSIIGAIFNDNEALSSLTNTDAFSKELYDIFGKFIISDILPKNLQQILENTSIDKSDKERLQKIIATYDTYLEKSQTMGYTDKRSLPQLALEALTPEYQQELQRKFKNIIIDNAQDITAKEIELFEKISENLYFIIHKFDSNNNQETARNEFEANAYALVNKFCNKDYPQTVTSSAQISYRQFSDLKDEIETIADEIIQNTTEKKCGFKDITIISRNENTTKLLENIFLLKDISIMASFEDSEFKSFTVQLAQQLNICALLKNLNAKTIYETRFDCAKYKLETNFNEINQNFENLLSFCLENQFTKDKLLNIHTTRNALSLISTTKLSVDGLATNDKNILLKELEKLEKVYQLFTEDRLTDIIIYLAKTTNKNTASFKSNLAALLTKIKTLVSLSQSLNNKPPEISAILNIVNTSISEKYEIEDTVRIKKLENATAINAKYVYLIDLTENNIPKTNKNIQFISEDSEEKITCAIKETYTGFDSLIENKKQQICEEAKHFAKCFLNRPEHLILSTHIYEEKKEVQPSPFFLFLTSTNQKTTKKIITPQKIQDEVQTQLSIQLQQKEDNVIDENETLKLNASAIATFQACPRKFYYKHLLKLKETGTFAANYGTIVHKIMELLSKNHLNEYTKETLIFLSEKLFNAQNKPEEALNSGFSMFDIELIQATDTLQLSEMREQLLSAADELEKSGFFNKSPQEIICEQSFTYTTEKLPNITIDGRIDAIYKFNDEYEIVDFKTGTNKPELSYLISENGVSFLTKTGKENSSLQNKFEYQIPLYHFATENSEELKKIKEKVKEYYLLYIRPKNKKGIEKDSIDTATMKKFEDRIIENLQKTIIDKIRNKSYFEAQIDERNCKYCSFKILCDEDACGGEDE